MKKKKFIFCLPHFEQKNRLYLKIDISSSGVSFKGPLKSIPPTTAGLLLALLILSYLRAI